MTVPDLRDQSFTLSALAAEVARWSVHLPVADDRVAPQADERTLRYYQSLGLLDRPVRYDGRQAVYGYRHLLQALATRALQGQGLSLAQAQRALAGVTTEALEAALLPALGEGGAPSGLRAVPSAPEPAAAPRPEATPWHTYELAPGLFLTLDPARYPDPAALVAALLPHLPGRRP